MLGATSGTSASPDENIKSVQDNKKLEEKKRHDKIVARWRIIVGLFFLALLVAVVFYLVKGFNWVIGKSSASNTVAPITYQLRGTAEPTVPSGQVVSNFNVLPACDIIGDRSACTIPGPDLTADNPTNPAGATTAATGGNLSGTTNTGCPDFLGDVSACVPIDSPVLNPVSNNTTIQTTSPQNTTTNNLNTTTTTNNRIVPSCPDFLGDVSACVPIGPSYWDQPTTMTNLY